MDQDQNYIETIEEETRELEELEELDNEDSKLGTLDEDLGTETSTDLAIMQEGILAAALPVQAVTPAAPDAAGKETALPRDVRDAAAPDTEAEPPRDVKDAAAPDTEVVLPRDVRDVTASDAETVLPRASKDAATPGTGATLPLDAKDVAAADAKETLLSTRSGAGEEEAPFTAESTTDALQAAGTAAEMNVAQAAGESPITAANGQAQQSESEHAASAQAAQGEMRADAAAMTKAPQMVSVVGVRFRSAGRVYYFSSGQMDIHRGTHVIVDTTRGMEYGTAVSVPFLLDQNKFKAPLRPVMRMATTADTDRHEDHVEREIEARRICQQRIRAHHLDMKLIDAEYTFDGNKILFYFTADGRVDFRDLVRDLAGIFHTRIELRQVGVRDETRILGGYGVCGRPLCCHTYLTDFVPVSIRMAKEQNLSLNPAKISGVCGRLMCCLKNEEETYEELNKTLPHVGDEVESADGLQGEVENVNVLRQRVRIIVEKDDEKELHEYDAKDLTVLRRRRRGQAKPHLRREEVSGSVQSHVKEDAPANSKGTGDILEGTQTQLAADRVPDGQKSDTRAEVGAGLRPGARADAGTGQRSGSRTNGGAGRKADARANGAGGRMEPRNRSGAGGQFRAKTGDDVNGRSTARPDETLTAARPDDVLTRERVDTTGDRIRPTTGDPEQFSGEEADRTRENAGSRRSGRRNLRRDRQPGKAMTRVTQAQDEVRNARRDGSSQRDLQDLQRNQRRTEGSRQSGASNRREDRRGSRPEGTGENPNRPADKRGNPRGQQGGRKHTDRSAKYSGGGNNRAGRNNAKDTQVPGNDQA